jgi:hypothetical protein
MLYAPVASRPARRRPRWVRRSQPSPTAACLSELETVDEASAPPSNQPAKPCAAGFGTQQMIMQCAPAASRRARRRPPWARRSQLSPTAACLPATAACPPEPATAVEAPAPSSNQPAWPCAASFGSRQMIMQCAPAAPRRARRRPRWVRRSQLSPTAACPPATAACPPESATVTEAPASSSESN